MASKDDGEKPNCTITWIIENVSFCWQKKREKIESPVFPAETMEETRWTLWLYIRYNNNGIGFFLERENDGTGVELIEVVFELAFLAADGSVLTSRESEKRTFTTCGIWGWNEFEKQENVFAKNRSMYLPHDSLTVRCRMWKKNEKTAETRQFFAKTIIQVERQTFVWRIEKFSSLEPGQKNKISIKSASGVVLLTCDLRLTGGLCVEKFIDIHIVTSNRCMKSLKFQTFLVHSDRRKTTDCGKKEFISDALRQGDLTLLLSQKQLIEQKSLYLPNDVLTLNCECAFSTGVASEVFEITDFGNIPSETKDDVVTNVNELSEERPLKSLLDGLEFLYKNEILCDTKLCTKTEAFPVHSVLLSAISPVFRAMFTTDMKEKEKENVDIPDVDADTLRQMLQYVYTETLDIRDWEMASLLYTAADKYEIISLRNLCSSYLKNNFCPTNACQVLVLSDMHNDKDLKKAVQDYILKEGVIMFKSNEWIRFMEENVKLAAETMHLNCI